MHAEVTSIRARRSGGQIRYRAVDEYEGEYSVQLQKSSLPLTMAELISLIDSADDGCTSNGLIIGFGERQIEYEFNEEDLRASVVVESDYYPQLAAWYEELVEEFIEEHRPELDGRDERQYEK